MKTNCLGVSSGHRYGDMCVYIYISLDDLQDLSSPVRNRTLATAVKVLKPNHWTTRNSLVIGVFLNPFKRVRCAARIENHYNF